MFLTAQVYSYPLREKSVEDNKICLACHGTTDINKKAKAAAYPSLYVNPREFEPSIHGDRMCTECHTYITDIPHKKKAEKVECGRCHYVKGIVPETVSRKSAQYKESVHQMALKSGNPKAPSCQDCHGSHDVLNPADPKSSVSFHNIPRTCGKCHLDIYSEYKESIHGSAWLKGNTDVPVCTSCHGEHNILAVKNQQSSVSSSKIPGTCSKCHAEEQIMKKYGIEANKYETYRESFHGIANKYGNLVVANCASCHGFHDILPSSDPRSSVNRDNLVKTCGKCHANPTENVAKGKIHVVISKKDSTILYYVSEGFKWLTICTISALVGHILLDLFARWRKRRAEIRAGREKRTSGKQSEK
ncbi:MAG: hypothetical protein M1536_04880 [Firmicutes bacterium]|nr:hypothetical protein [Bacillota bacterium]